MKKTNIIQKNVLILGMLLTGATWAQNTVTVGGQINSISGSESNRRQLRDITNTAMDPAGSEATRPAHETGLLTLLEGSTDPDISGIFFRELTLSGTDVATVTGIGTYLSDDDLVIEASRTLIGIGTYEGGATLVEACRVIGVALPSATGASKTALQKAAGSLACKDAAVVANLNENSDDLMAVRAIALIGDPTSKEEVIAALNNDNYLEQTKTIDWATDYVVALAERNHKDVSAEVITAIEAVITGEDYAHMTDHVAAVKAVIPTIQVGVEHETRNVMKKNAIQTRTLTGGLIEVNVLQGGSFLLEVHRVSGTLLTSITGNSSGVYNFDSREFASGLYILALHINGESYQVPVTVQ